MPIDFLPFQSNSITKKWMEHQHSKKEALPISIALGVIAGFAGYYSRNAFLTIGTGSFLTQVFLQKECPSIKERDAFEILSFASFCSFLGLTIKDSWFKAASPKPYSWIQSPLYFLALTSIHFFTCRSTKRLTDLYVEKIDSERSNQLLCIAAFAISTSSTYLIPRIALMQIIPAVVLPLRTLKSSIEAGNYLKNTGKDLQKSVLLASSILAGSLGGVVLRNVIGPKDYSPAFHPIGKGINLTLITCYFVSFLTIATLILKKEIAEECLSCSLPQWLLPQTIRQTILDQIGSIDDSKSLEEIAKSLYEKVQNSLSLCIYLQIIEILQAEEDCGTNVEDAIQEIREALDLFKK